MPTRHHTYNIPPRAPCLYIYVATPASRLQTSKAASLHVAIPAARFQASKAPYLHAATAILAANLQRSIRLLLHIATPASSLQTCRSPRFHVCTPSSRPQPPSLHVCTPAARLQSPELHASTSHACDAASQSSIPLHTFSAPPSARCLRIPSACVQRSMPHNTSSARYLRVATPASRLQTSILPRRYTCSVPPHLHSSIPPRQQTCSLPLELLTSMPPCQHESGAPAESSIHLWLPRLHAYSGPLELYTSMLSP